MKRAKITRRMNDWVKGMTLSVWERRKIDNFGKKQSNIREAGIVCRKYHRKLKMGFGP